MFSILPINWSDNILCFLPTYVPNFSIFQLYRIQFDSRSCWNFNNDLNNFSLCFRNSTEFRHHIKCIWKHCVENYIYIWIYFGSANTPFISKKKLWFPCSKPGAILFVTLFYDISATERDYGSFVRKQNCNILWVSKWEGNDISHFIVLILTKIPFLIHLLRMYNEFRPALFIVRPSTMRFTVD